jgi:putative oxidoreductase
MADGKATTLDDIGKLILRITVAGLMLFHGIAKLIHGIAFISGDMTRIHLPVIFAYLVYVGEVAAPLFLLVGLWTRIAATLVIIDLVVAVLLSRLPAFFSLSRSGGWSLELEAFFLFAALAIAFLGPGRLKVLPRRRV